MTTHGRTIPLLALAALLVALGLAACGGGASDPPAATSAATAETASPATTQAEPVAGTTEAAAASGPWSFTDDRDVEVTLEEAPVRIVAEADSARALYDLGITPVGIFGSAPLDRLPQLEGLPLDDVASLGSVYGEVNVEQLAALDPDLIVTTTWPPEPLAWGIADEALQEKIVQVAPIVAIDARQNARHGIRRFEELAAALGADLGAEAVQAAKARFEAAEAALREATAAKPDLRVLAVSGSADTLWVAKPADYADLSLYLELGVQFVTPDVKDDYWQALSWEQADRYPADVMFVDARVFAEGNPEDSFANVPTWRQLPAVEAGQVGPWHALQTFSYANYAANLEELAQLIERSQVVTS